MGVTGRLASQIKNQAPGNSSPHVKGLDKLIPVKNSSVAMELIERKYVLIPGRGGVGEKMGSSDP